MYRHVCLVICAAVMAEVCSCCRELVETYWTRKLVPETLDTRKRMERLLQVFTRLDENGKRCVHCLIYFLVPYQLWLTVYGYTVGSRVSCPDQIFAIGNQY